MAFSDLKRLWDFLNQFSAHADVQLVSQTRGFSLEEFVQQKGKQVLIKSENGPFISKNPWDDLISGN